MQYWGVFDHAKIWKAKRLELGLTQGQMAEQVDVSRRTISNIESGAHVPQFSVQVRFKTLCDKVPRCQACGQELASKKVR